MELDAAQDLPVVTVCTLGRSVLVGVHVPRMSPYEAQLFRAVFQAKFPYVEFVLMAELGQHDAGKG